MLNALYFPDTAPQQAALRQLLLFFDTMTCYRPVENDPSLDPLLHIEGWLTEYTPVPLADERTNFLQLIKDVKQNGLQYLEGFLSSLAVQAAKDRDELASWSLFSRLKKPAADTARNQSREVLWQARFILKLAEVYAEEEREIIAGLRAAETGKKKLLQALHGGTEEDLSDDDAVGDAEDASMIFPDLSVPDQLRMPIPVKRLITSWSNFFIRDPKADSHWILVTAMEEAADELIDICAGQTEQKPLLLTGLSLPDVANMPDNVYSEERSAFRRQRQEWLASFADDIKTLAFTVNTDGNERQRLLSRIAEATHTWPANNVASAENQIALTLLPGVSPVQLLNHFVRKPDKEEKKNRPLNTILAVLRKQQG